MADNSCRWCGAEQLFGPVHMYTAVAGSGGDLQAATVPATGMVRQQTTVPVGVWVCRQCGHLAMFATQPNVLFERWSAGER